MSYTYADEEIEPMRGTLVSNIRDLIDALNKRIFHNSSGWSEEHRKDCMEVVKDLHATQLRLEKL